MTTDTYPDLHSGSRLKAMLNFRRVQVAIEDDDIEGIPALVDSMGIPRDAFTGDEWRPVPFSDAMIAEWSMANLADSIEGLADRPIGLIAAVAAFRSFGWRLDEGEFAIHG